MSEALQFPGASEVATTLADHIANKIIIITGTSPNGLGAAAAAAITPHNPALLVLTGRSHALVEETERQLLATTPDLKTKLLIFDLGDLKSVRNAVSEIMISIPRIDVIINNAGIMAAPFSKSVDGYESQFAVNHLGHFLFTNLLSDKLMTGARIVNVSSAGYIFGKVRHDDPNFEAEEYDKWLAYGQSKSANVLFSQGLAARLGNRNISAFTVLTGGGAFTKLQRHLTKEDIEMLVSTNKIDIITQDQAAVSHVAAAFDPRFEVYGGAIIERGEVTAFEENAPWVQGKDNVDNLWKLSEKMVGQKFEF